MSRFLDERGRIFGKVNVIDILVLLVILALITLALVRLTGATVETVPVQVRYAVEQVRQPTADMILADAVMHDRVTNETGTVLGQIIDVQWEPALVEYMTSQDEVEAFPSPVFRNVFITIRGEGIVSGDRVSIGGVRLATGKRVTLVGPRFEVLSNVLQVLYGDEVPE